MDIHVVIRADCTDCFIALGVLGKGVRLGSAPMLKIGGGPPCQVPPLVVLPHTTYTGE